MTKLCEVCKQVEVDSADLICTVCIQEKKEKLQKKRKKVMLIGLVSSLILIIGGLLLFLGSQVYSKEKTEEKFFLALENQDKQLLKSIVYHNDFTCPRIRSRSSHKFSTKAWLRKYKNVFYTRYKFKSVWYF